MSGPEFPTIEAMRAELDVAFSSNEIVRLNEHFVLVPDVMMLEALANGREFPPTPGVERKSDGRAVYVYREYELRGDR